MNKYVIIALRAEDRTVFPSAVKAMSVSSARIAFTSAQDKLCKILSVTQVPANSTIKLTECKETAE